MPVYRLRHHHRFEQCHQRGGGSDNAAGGRELWLANTTTGVKDDLKNLAANETMLQLSS